MEEHYTKLLEEIASCKDSMKKIAGEIIEASPYNFLTRTSLDMLFIAFSQLEKYLYRPTKNVASLDFDHLNDKE